MRQPTHTLAGTECLDIFSPAPGDRDLISQVLRDSSIETKIAPRSVRIAACAGQRASLSNHRLQSGCVSNLTLPERRSLAKCP
jgi:hypothetical protein